MYKVLHFLVRHNRSIVVKENNGICRVLLIGGCMRYSSVPVSPPFTGITDQDDETALHSNSPMSENDVVNPEFINRNPRNLELLRVARKREGWKFQYPAKNFYHRLRFNLGTRLVTGFVENAEGNVLIQASTREFALAKFLTSGDDVTASANVGRVLAMRCKQSGITRMEYLRPLDIDYEMIQAFIKEITQGGILLSETEVYVPQYKPGIDYENEEALQDLYDRQLKVASVTPEHLQIHTIRRRKNGIKDRLPKPPANVYDKSIDYAPYNKSEG